MPPSMTVDDVLAWLRRRGTRKNLLGMARFGIVAPKAFGVPMGTMQSLAKRIGKDHTLALALWDTGYYEARMVATMVDDPKQVTRRQMDQWTAAFDNWGICDTACFVLYDRTPFAWDKARRWCRSPREFVRRAGFALMAVLAGHDKTATDAQFRALLPLIEKGARDERNFVKKGVSWALRRIGRRNRALNTASVAVARRLAASAEAPARWVGKDALRELSNAKVQARLR